MTRKLRIGVVALAGSMLLAGGATGARAQSGDALKCAAAKLKAVGKDWQKKLKCHGKAVKDGAAVDGECLTKAETKTSDAFAKAEAKGGCATDGNLFDLNNDSVPDGMVQSVLNQTNNGFSIGSSVIYRGIDGPVVSAVNEGVVATAVPSPSTPSKCADKKLGALGKFAAALYKCESKEAKKNLPDDAECVDKAIAKFNGKVAKEEEPGNDCQTTGDGEFLSGEIFRTFLRVVPSIPRFDGCGNTLITPGESCDDGNTAHFDSCPSDCTIDACTPTANPRPVTVVINDMSVASLTIELDYPEGKVSLPGTGFEGDVTNLTAGVMDSLDFDHAIRIVVSDAASLGQTDIAQLNFVDCSVGGPPVVGDFACTVTGAFGPGGTPDLTASTTCTVTIP
jgi:cysteine-rich repeat protein